MRTPTASSAHPSSLKPPARELFKNLAYEELRSRLQSNQYPPGTFLSERQLAAELKMSKTPIKAALQRLETEGYLMISPQSGIRVLEMSDKEIADLYEIRMALEGYVLDHLAGKLTDEQLQQWTDNVNASAAIVDATDERRRAVSLDTEFHILPCRFLGNETILKAMQQMSTKIEIVINRVFSLLPNRAAESLIEHRLIIEAVKNGNGNEARNLVEAHLRTGHEILSRARVKK